MLKKFTILFIATLTIGHVYAQESCSALLYQTLAGDYKRTNTGLNVAYIKYYRNLFGIYRNIIARSNMLENTVNKINNRLESYVAGSRRGMTLEDAERLNAKAYINNHKDIESTKRMLRKIQGVFGEYEASYFKILENEDFIKLFQKNLNDIINSPSQLDTIKTELLTHEYADRFSQAFMKRVERSNTAKELQDILGAEISYLDDVNVDRAVRIQRSYNLYAGIMEGIQEQFEVGSRPKDILKYHTKNCIVGSGEHKKDLSQDMLSEIIKIKETIKTANKANQAINIAQLIENSILSTSIKKDLEPFHTNYQLLSQQFDVHYNRIKSSYIYAKSQPDYSLWRMQNSHIALKVPQTANGDGYKTIFRKTQDYPLAVLIYKKRQSRIELISALISRVPFTEFQKYFDRYMLGKLNNKYGNRFIIGSIQKFVRRAVDLKEISDHFPRINEIVGLNASDETKYELLKKYSSAQHNGLDFLVYFARHQDVSSSWNNLFKLAKTRSNVAHPIIRDSKITLSDQRLFNNMQKAYKQAQIDGDLFQEDLDPSQMRTAFRLLGEFVTLSSTAYVTPKLYYTLHQYMEKKYNLELPELPFGPFLDDSDEELVKSEEIIKEITKKRELKVNP